MNKTEDDSNPIELNIRKLKYYFDMLWAKIMGKYVKRNFFRDKDLKNVDYIL